MGSLSRFDLNRIIREYRIVNFFETGTYWGDGVGYALQSPFLKIISVEIIPELATAAKQRFKTHERVEIIQGDSISALKMQLPSLSGNTIFWLDAHFPGADAKLADYASGDDLPFRLPMLKEVELIYTYRKNFQDVLILDDLRIYEDGPYQNGPVPPDALPKGERTIKLVYQYFERSHYIFKSFLDEGYILLFPKRSYDRCHFKLSELFIKKPVVEDLYLL